MSATARLTFLYPQLLRTVRRTTQPQIKSSVGWAPRRHKSSFPPRVGKAVAPTTWELEQQKEAEQLQQTQTTESAAEPRQQAAQDATTPTERDTESVPAAEPETIVTEIKATTEQPPTKVEEPVKSSSTAAAEESTAEPATEQSAEVATEDDAKKEPTPEEDKVRQSKEEARSSGPLEAVMLMQPPEQVAKQHPSLSPSRYVHHFDSYSLVKQLEDGGYTREQAVTSMKAIRKLLAVNLDVAQESLVSKSDVENETYLFTAACSELATEIRNNRRLSDEHTRQERTHVQHDVDILTQTLNQELLTLNDNVRGMFNDRKMAAREEQNTVDSAVQKLNYKISIVLTSDAKSEIESVRWTLIRRSVLGIIFMAFLTLGTLRYATYVGQQRKLEAAKKKKEEEEARKGPAKREPVDGPDAAEILAAN